MALVQLGNFQFRIDTLAYQTLAHNNVWRWNVINTVGNEQVLQYAGKGDETIQLTGMAIPSYNSNRPNEEIVAQAERKTPLFMVATTGEVIGQFIIESISFEHTDFHKSGLAHIANFTIALRRYKRKAVPTGG